MKHLKNVVLFTSMFGASMAAQSSELLNNASNTWEFEQYKNSLIQEIKDTHTSYQTMINESGSVHIMAPAAPLSSFEIRGVISSNYPQWEGIAPNAFSTTQDHGGREVYILTREIGYANPSSRIAKLNGSSLSVIDTHPVTSGSSVVGYLVVWKYSVGTFTSGTATASARSINFPNNQEDDRLYIR
ncbi:DUF4879 domain-containing protein [Pseudoalteromonas luteoviolacea]|uniref:DUF4879 domain-containing protein n=1 Tax=Pseudoalteromonas luteoviolacea TaxID=43657 RepID=UPI001B371A03|nr:DUF4879 domain-containing protein [Pseudoalteromonas luteoviolacea]MBQ4839509.1 DUF4879 domain-containing protein [Pseudoalteromonas luteoviolacea]